MISVIIFDCNGVLVDSEQLAATAAAHEFTRIGIPITSELVMRYFLGRRPADMFAAVEAATCRELPAHFVGDDPDTRVQFAVVGATATGFEMVRGDGSKVAGARTQ